MGNTQVKRIIKKMSKTYIVSASIEIEVCDCENEYEAIDHATDLIDLGNIEFEAEEVEVKNDS